MKAAVMISLLSLLTSFVKPASEILPVLKCADFEVTGKGENSEWEKASWHQLTKLDSGGSNYESKFKIMYSSAGIYLLFYGTDQKITTRFTEEFGDLYNGDVFEVFFHPDTATPLYLEYEINALNKELVLLVPHLKDRVHGWLPWHYENNRKVKKAVFVEGGSMIAGSIISSWQAELFMPFSLFSPLGNVPPVKGTEWNANFYRLDYDSGKMIKWAWTPVEKSFHEFEKYARIRFE